MDEAVLKKITLLKVQVVPLNGPTDFGVWHLALKRLVKGYGMGDALLFSVPEDRSDAYKLRAEKLSKMKEEEENKKESSDDDEEPRVYEENPSLYKKSSKFAQDVEDEPPASQAKPEHITTLLGAGITKSMDDFFSATTVFVNMRTKDTEREGF